MVAEFTADLRQAREQTGKPSLRQMSRRAGYSHTVLLSALFGTGGRLPSLGLTLVLLRRRAGMAGTQPDNVDALTTDRR